MPAAEVRVSRGGGGYGGGGRGGGRWDKDRRVTLKPDGV